MPEEIQVPEQAKAIETLEGDLLASAGAGTGKTRALTRRFIHIVTAERAAVDEILTLTFTEKAAREMKERIVQRFDELGRERDRRAVETAYISTIHSFCARVLRENALEAGVDPYFTQLDEADAAIAQRRVYDDLVRRAHAENNAAVLTLVSEFDAGSLRDLLFSLYRRMRSLGKAPAELMVAPAHDSQALDERARAAVEEAARLRPASSAMADTVEAIQRSLPRLNRLLDIREFDWNAYHDLGEVARLFKGNVGTRDQQPVMAQAKEAVGSFAAALLSQLAAAHAQALRELLAAFDVAYSAAKDEEGQLDFDDLLAKARDLFGAAERPTATARAYRERFKFFLMDEFQDTNRLQWSVVEPIARPQRRFTVGDAKQSIYRFLYADVDVFLERERKLSAAGGLLPPLSRNFRSHPELLGFTNAFFRDLWAEDEFPFGELSAGKQFGEREEPRVEVLVVAGADSMPQAREQEAELLARRICEMTGLGGGAPMMLTERGNEHPACCGDIMVLFRATTDIQIYEDALDEYGIPYYTVRGRGFYHTQELQDLRNLLAAIENPMDDVALAAALRSPLVGVTDEALYWLGAPAARAERDEDEPQPQGAGRVIHHLEHLDALRHLLPRDRARLEAFRELLNDLRRSAAESRIADLLDEAIRRTDYDLQALCQRSGRRRYANIEKLRQIAVAFQGEAHFSLRDFLDYLETLEVVAERETEAATEAEEADVVRLMTVHAAKGLEAPIVIVADLSRGLDARADAAILSDEGELALRLRDPLADEFVKSAAYESLAQVAADADRLEDKRLFYVACTRAQEHLVLSGCLAEKPGGSSRGKRPGRERPYRELSTWGQWIAKFLGLEQPPAAEDQLLHGDGFTARVRFQVSPPAASASPRPAPLLKRFRQRVESREPLDIALIAPDCDAQELRREAQMVAERVVADAGRGSPRPGASVTGALRYRACPRLFELTVVQRLPEENPPREAEPDAPLPAEPEDEAPQDRGTRLHDLLSRLDFHAKFEEELARLTRDLDDAEAADAREVLRRFRDHELWPRLAGADERGELWRETPFVIGVAGGWLRGRIDALMREGSEWTLLDYKSGESRAEEYAGQIRLYALACRGLLGVTPARGIIYYLDSGETETVANDDRALERAAADVESVMRGIAAGNYERREGAACAACAFAACCRPG